MVEQIERLIHEYDVTLIVIGWPLRLNGREGIQTQKVARFMTRLAPTGLPIERWDERLTTHSAERTLREGGVKGKSRREVVDQVAAAIILQAGLTLSLLRGHDDHLANGRESLSFVTYSKRLKSLESEW